MWFRFTRGGCVLRLPLARRANPCDHMNMLHRYGVEHMPYTLEETHVILFEPATTLNTGNVQNERTVANLQRI